MNELDKLIATVEVAKRLNNAINEIKLSFECDWDFEKHVYIPKQDWEPDEVEQAQLRFLGSVQQYIANCIKK